LRDIADHHEADLYLRGIDVDDRLAAAAIPEKEKAAMSAA